MNDDPHYGGDPARHLDPAVLDDVLSDLHPPRDAGTVKLLVSRPRKGERVRLERGILEVGAPFAGDRWSPARDPDCNSQITVMAWDVGERIRNGQDLALFGDNLVVDLALDADNLPAGSRLRVGAAEVEVTAKAHTGCKQYAGRFGVDTLAWISRPERKPLRLRGIHVRVVTSGEVATGDPVVVLRRGAP